MKKPLWLNIRNESREQYSAMVCAMTLLLSPEKTIALAWYDEKSKKKFMDRVNREYEYFEKLLGDKE